MRDETRTCCKCGCDDIHTRWHLAHKYEPPGRCCGFFDANKAETEHLHDYCRGCGFDWTRPILGVLRPEPR